MEVFHYVFHMNMQPFVSKNRVHQETGPFHSLYKEAFINKASALNILVLWGSAKPYSAVMI